MRVVSVKDAAKMLGISRGRVRVLIREHRLPATRIDRVWVLDPEQVVEFSKIVRPTGRPRRAKEAAHDN